MTGNILFIGLALGQANNGLLIRAVRALLLNFVGVTMGIQGAIVVAFEFPGVVANAMTAVVIVMGQRVGRGIVHAGPAGE